MKILYVDISTSGHHISYLSALATIDNSESVIITPNKINDLKHPQYILLPPKRSFRGMKTWMREVYKIALNEQPDIVHFLYGDMFYRFFGLGLNLFRNYKTVLTLHWAKTSFVGRISTRIICSKFDKVVVHSSYIEHLFYSDNIKNVVNIEYPHFNEKEYTKKEALKFWNMNENIPVIACIGNTRYDKGLDILLDALSLVNTKFQLLIAGKEATFSQNFIEEKIKNYRNNVTLCMRFLNDEEISMAFSVADIIALPYRKNFNGASGPLGEGVWLKKCIVGSNHGNLGYTIEKYHLGAVFQTEDNEELAKTLEICLKQNFVPDSTYCEYRNK